MLRSHTRALFAAVLLAASACNAASLNPILAPSDSIPDARLVGTWTQSGNRVVVAYDAAERNFTLKLTNADGEKIAMRGVLGRVGNRLLLDLFGDDEADPTPKRVLQTPMHIALVIETLSDRTLTTRVLNEDSVATFVPAVLGSSSYSHPDGSRMVVTAPTATLRRAVAQFLQRPGVLGDPVTYTRVR